MADAIEIRHYINNAGQDVFVDWLSRLADIRAKAKIVARIDRLAAGNLGDTRALGPGLYELRIDLGPGYPVYFTMIGTGCGVLLCLGSKAEKSFAIDPAPAD